MEHFDVLVVGAGISGVGAAYHLKKMCPKTTFAIFEAREAVGGTWDLFRYPGIRSDSDMYTLGFSFRPWTQAKAIADGPAILSYLQETVKAYDIDPHIGFGRKVKAAAWDSSASRWTVDYEEGSERTPRQVTCNFLHMCAGYYNYESGYRPRFAGEEDFSGLIVHPQFWPEGLDYAGKRVVVIGSGATAVTLVPEMAKTAAKVTMLQRSPTYVVSRPAEDAFANTLRARLPAMLAYRITRWRNVLFGMYFYNLTRKKPDQAKAQIVEMVEAQLGPDYDVKTHFTPSYNPWDQRLCLVPDADLFKAIRSGAADVVTDRIERFDASGVQLASGARLDADVVVTATGLDMQLMSGLEVSVDGERVDLPSTFSYKGMMYSGVPNLASTFGYTNASWTLKADLTAEYLCRLINHMRRRGLTECRPLATGPIEPTPWLDFSSGYVQRALSRLPRQGTRAPWRVYQNYALDLLAFRFGKLDDGVMRFSRPHVVRPAGRDPAPPVVAASPAPEMADA
jgi:cation diffusion facilitator CzcD-associated flavoprotein CzcO